VHALAPVLLKTEQPGCICMVQRVQQDLTESKVDAINVKETHDPSTISRTSIYKARGTQSAKDKSHSASPDARRAASYPTA
jgi:hypothetical protein